MKKENLKNLLLTLGLSACVLIVYKIGGTLIDKVTTNTYVRGFAAQFVFAAAATAAMVILKRTEVLHSDRKYLNKGWTSAFVLIFMILFLAFIGLGGILNATCKWWEGLLFVLQMLLVGYCEELLFRGLIQNALHDCYGEDTWAHVMLAILVSGAIFGGVHLLNALRPGVSFMAAFMQAFVNVFAGIYYAAVYYRTGKNLWYILVLHAFYDMFAMIGTGILAGTTVDTILNSAESIQLTSVLFWIVVYGGATLLVMRPNAVKPLLKAPEQTVEN